MSPNKEQSVETSIALIQQDIQLIKLRLEKSDHEERIKNIEMLQTRIVTGALVIWAISGIAYLLWLNNLKYEIKDLIDQRATQISQESVVDFAEANFERNSWNNPFK